MDEYITKNVLKMGEEAMDLVLSILPVVLRIKVDNSMIDKQAAVISSIVFYLYRMATSRLNTHQTQITLRLWNKTF